MYNMIICGICLGVKLLGGMGIMKQLVCWIIYMAIKLKLLIVHNLSGQDRIPK
jgi:hypothetical protein